MIPVVSFVGRSGSGKTTLLEKVVTELKTRGYRVGVVKHTHHSFDMDHPGKDSWRLAQAGSDIVVLSSPNKVAFVERLDTELTLDEIMALFGAKVDIVLAEGYKNGDAAKILVLAAGQDQERLRFEEKPLATVLAHSSQSGMPQYDDDDFNLVIDLLIEQIGKELSDNIADTTSAVDLIPEYEPCHP